MTPGVPQQAVDQPATDGRGDGGAGGRGPAAPAVGVVVIGRNEGQRLERCLRSVTGGRRTVVYVDSGSSDGSVAIARRANVDVVELDAGRAFTAARARNAGVDRLRELEPGLELMQFVDGDCELADGWIERARDELHRRPEVVAVRGRLHERHPEASIYNRLCEIEWNAPAGPVAACGGVFMVRLAALGQAGGFDETLIAGEEPELCVRLRRGGGEIWCLDADMAVHDAAMMSFRAWWKRMVRGGHAYAQGAAMHGASPERHFVRECVSIVFWAALLPLAAIVPAIWFGPWCLLPLSAYPLQVARIAARRRRHGESVGDAVLFAAACVMAKWPQLAGMLKFGFNRLRGRQSRLIEHKSLVGSNPDAGVG